MRGFISSKERKQLLKKANQHFTDGLFRSNSAGADRFVMRLDSPEQLKNKLINKINDRIVKAVGLENCPVEPILNRLISRLEPGAFIHEHLDKLETLAKLRPNINTSTLVGENLRCNIMIKSCGESAYPVIDGQQIEINEGDAWAFYPSLSPHGTNVIKNSSRIIYGFGFIVPETFKIKSL